VSDWAQRGGEEIDVLARAEQVMLGTWGMGDVPNAGTTFPSPMGASPQTTTLWGLWQVSICSCHEFGVSGSLERQKIVLLVFWKA